MVITHLLQRFDVDIRHLRARDRHAARARRWTLLDAPASALRARRSMSTGPMPRAVAAASSRAKARTRCTAASTCARPAATSARWSRWSARWPASAAWITGLRREQSGARAEVAARSTHAAPSARQGQPAGRLDLGRRVALHRHARRALQPAARPVLPEHRLRALHARRHAWARTSAPAAGGGKQESAKECGLHVRRQRPHHR